MLLLWQGRLLEGLDDVLNVLARWLTSTHGLREVWDWSSLLLA